MLRADSHVSRLPSVRGVKMPPKERGAVNRMSIPLISSANMAEPIEMLLGRQTYVGPIYHVFV